MYDETKYWWKLFQTADFKGIAAGLSAHSGQISVGLSQGFSAILVPKLLSSKFATISEASWIASLGVISNPLGAFLAGFLAEYYGRRAAIGLATLPHATGWLLITLAHNVPMLYIGRFISGIGTGMANALYLYVIEAAAPHQRAWLASSGPILVSLGVLASYALGAVTTWQRSAAISIGPAIFTLALTRVIPESPAWLVRQGRFNEAKESLIWLRGPGLIWESEYNDLCTSSSIINQQNNGKGQLSKELCITSVIWKPFIILFLFFALQQLCGIYIILFYAVNVLENIGTSIDEYAGSIAIGVVRFVASILGASLAKNFGRKTMACSSAIGMALSALVVGLTMRYHKIPSLLSLICIGLHVGFSMIGYLTLPWVMTSELYPLRFRGIMGGITTAIAQIMTFIAIKTYPHVNNKIGLEATMYIFAISAVLGAIFAITFLPETKGKTLDEIAKEFSSQENISSINNIIMEKYSCIHEDKYPRLNTIIIPSGCDNLGIDLNDDEEPRLKFQEIDKTNQNHNCVLKISSLEHVYL
ncbi:hypothetical protein PV327_009385 [Microctonus hyperodae]|uniref:Major facilitator superfamily (MFS) profile domain-containing protein n=1 Tax=Microctonus hyperodae TaxID=165561 RepID=A0AA39FU99_MICHY|nr:hypothetical protein PV327_009385 [Microctonus hyperodae]